MPLSPSLTTTKSMASPSPRVYNSKRMVLLLVFIFDAIAKGIAKGIVAELNDEYFKEGLVDYNHAVVVFYSQSCVHCSEFLPIFHLAADELIRNEPPVHSAMVDCIEGGKIVCKEEEIKHLPTVKIFRKGVLYDEYDEKRTVDNLVAYIRKLVGITSVELPLDCVKGFAENQKEVTVVAVLKAEGNLREDYFSLPAELSKDIKFAHVTIGKLDGNKAIDLNLTYGVSMYQPGHMRNKFEPWSYEYDSSKELLQFITENRHGIVGLRDTRHIDDFVPPLVIIYFRFDINLRAKMFSYWRNRIVKVAKDYEAYFNFAISPIDDFHNEFVKFGIPMPEEAKKDTPLVFAILADNTKYLLDGMFSVAGFEDFLQGILNDSLEPHLKSQPIQEVTPGTGTVQVAVAKNFKKEVWGNSKDVVLELYAPWCGICKDLGVVLDKLAEILVDEEVAVFKMDATENEIPANFDTIRFPTVFYLPKKNVDQPILYQGGVDLKELLSFVAEHSSKELINFDRSGRAKKIDL